MCRHLRSWLISLWVAALLSGTGQTGHAQIPDPDPGPSAHFYAGYSAARPNLELPSHVVAPEGKFTLFADFEHATAEGIPLYLVNRTDSPRSLTIQPITDLRLTYRSDGGNWVQAQSQVFMVDCISGDIAISLPPGHHVRSIGYAPAGGTPGKVRYQLFEGDREPIVSNEGDGRWIPSDVADAERSTAALRMIRGGNRNLAFMLRYFEGNPDLPALRESVADGLAQLDLSSRWRPRMETTVQLQQIRLILGKLKPRTDVEFTQIRQRLDEIEKSLLAPPAEPAAFHLACLGMIRKPASQEFRPWIVWEEIHLLPAAEIPAEGWRETFILAQERLTLAGRREKDAIGRLFFSSGRWTSETVPTATLVSHITSDSETLSRACLRELATRKEYTALAQAGIKADGPLKLRIANDFLHEESGSGQGRRIRSYFTSDPAQKQFWESCIASVPWETFALLTPSSPGYLEPGLSLTFRAQFEEFLKKGTSGPLPVSGPEPLYGLLKYVEFLSARPNRGNLQLLRRTVALREQPPPDEPEAVRNSRDRLVTAAGQALRLDEYFR